MSRQPNPRARAAQAAIGAVVLGAGLFALPGMATAADSGIAPGATTTPAPSTSRTAVAPTATSATTTAPLGTTESTTAPTTTTAPVTTRAAATTTGSTTATPVTTTTSAPTTTTVPLVTPGCLPLTAGTFSHTFDPLTLTLTVDFEPADPAAAGTVLCGGGQPFTVATWATQATGYALPQRLLGTTDRTVTLAGTSGRIVVTAGSATGCAAQVDAYMAPASAVPAVLTGFNSGDPRDGGSDGGVVNEPPLVGTPQAPYPSRGTVTGQQPYTLVAGDVCTLPASIEITSSCTDGVASGVLALENTNPWTVAYTVELDGVEVHEDGLSGPGLAGGASASFDLGTLSPGGHTVTVTDENGVAATATTTVQACSASATTPPVTTTQSPTSTAVVPTVEGTTIERTPASTTSTTSAPSTSVEVAGVVVTRTTPGATGSGELASTGASVGLPLGLGAAALLLGGGLVATSRRTRGRHAR